MLRSVLGDRDQNEDRDVVAGRLLAALRIRRPASVPPTAPEPDWLVHSREAMARKLASRPTETPAELLLQIAQVIAREEGWENEPTIEAAEQAMQGLADAQRADAAKDPAVLAAEIEVYEKAEPAYRLWLAGLVPNARHTRLLGRTGIVSRQAWRQVERRPVRRHERRTTKARRRSGSRARARSPSRSTGEDPPPPDVVRSLAVAA